MEITREDLLNELRKRGYTAVANDVYKNDVLLEAIVIKDTPEKRIYPTLYTEPIIRECEGDIDKAIEMLLRIHDEHKEFNFDIDKIHSEEFIRERVYIGLERKSEHMENLTWRDVEEYPGLIQYLYLSGTEVGEGYSIKIPPNFFGVTGISEEEIWNIAREHTFNNIEIKTLSSVISQMLDADIPDDVADACEMYIITNHSKCKGAAGILNADLLKRFCIEHDCEEMVVIFSSIHECILVPVRYPDNFDKAMFDKMVREVNATQVLPEEQLANQCFIIRPM